MRSLFIALLLLSSISSKASSTVDVEWINSNPTYDTLLITVDGCSTFFKIKKEDVLKLLTNQAALNQAVKSAINHSKTGCK